MTNKLFYNGKEYTKKSLAKLIGISIPTLNNRLNKYHGDIESVVNAEDMRKKKFYFQGKEFKSKTEAAKYYNTTLELLTSRINAGYSPEVSLGLKPLNKLSKIFKFLPEETNYRTAYQRLIKGIDLIDAINPNPRRSPGRYPAPEKMQEEQKNKPALLYFCCGSYEEKIIYKIGVTEKNSLKSRGLPFKEIEILFQKELPLSKAVNIERNVLSLHFFNNEIYFHKKFSGHRECCKLSSESQVKQIIDFIEQQI